MHQTIRLNPHQNGSDVTEQGSLQAGNNLDPWYSHYAERPAGLRASEVRALFAVASRPEVVSLAGGMPFVAALPQDLVIGAMDRVMREQGAVALQYGSGQGVPALREQILEVMALEGIQRQRRRRRRHHRLAARARARQQALPRPG